jgi:pimeloyl-ACP methyl ester carboxylesterase
MRWLSRFTTMAVATALSAIMAGNLVAQTKIVDPPLRGTTFFGGAGMAGAYVEDMAAQMRAAGIANVRAAEAAQWSAGALLDGYAGLTGRGRDHNDTDFGAFGRTGSQFNLIGYSYGGLRAAQVAVDYTAVGGRVDHLVLIATPIDADFLAALQSDSGIGTVVVIDLTAEGDPIRAGMSGAGLAAGMPALGLDFIRSYMPSRFGPARGHFYYADPGSAGQRRRAAVAERLYRVGLR